MDYLGSLDQGLTYSLHALLLADDIAGLLRTLWRGVRIDGDMMALDLAKLVGPRGNYLAHRHTVDHCRENLWPSHYFGPSLPLSSDLRPDADLSARIEADLCRILEEHHPAPLESGLLAQIEAVRARFAAQIAA
jgi:trimethylamine--corrinoid protein Co-methyltransferase